MTKIVLKILAIAVKQEKEIKVSHIGKEEVKLSLFASGKKLHIKNPKESTKILLLAKMEA